MLCAIRRIVKELLASIPVPAKVVRHFAAATLVITACIALFADGERREAIGAELRADQQRQEMRALDAQRNGPQKVGANAEVRRGNGFGEESSGSSGELSGDPVSTGESGIGSVQYRPTGQDAASMPPGFSNPALGIPQTPQIITAPPKPAMKVAPANAEKLLRAAEDRAGQATLAGE